jgi:hypothetical protein
MIVVMVEPHQILDVIRYLVIVEAVGLMVFFAVTTWRSINTARCATEPVVRHLAWGRFFSSLGIELLVINGIIDITGRLGHHVMNWRTPFFQATMIFLTLGYWFRDRVDIHGSIR